MTDAAPGWEGYLEPGERVLWQGRPRGGIDWRRFAGQRTVIGLVFMGFALFWVISAFRAGASGLLGAVFPLFGLPFVWLGFRIAGGEELWRAWLRRRSWYTLTDRRAMIATEAFGRRGLESWPITAQSILEFEEGPPATIWFAERGRRGPGQTPADRRVGFVGIDDGAQVLRMMRQVQRGAA